MKTKLKAYMVHKRGKGIGNQHLRVLGGVVSWITSQLTSSNLERTISFLFWSL